MSAAGPRVRSVAIKAHAMQRNFLPILARMLKERHGCEVHLYCNGPGQQRFYEPLREAGCFDTVSLVDFESNLIDVDDVDREQLFEDARRWERKLGLTMNEIAMVDRHLGRGFALAGYYHPRSRISEGTSYEQMVRAFTERIARWDHELERRSVDLVVNGSRELVAVAMARGVPLRRLIRSRFGNHYYWAFNDKLLHPGVDARYRELPDDVHPEVPQEPAYSYEEGRRQFMRMYGGRLQLLRGIAHRIALHAYWRYKGSEKGRSYYAGEEIRQLVRSYRDLRRLTGRGMARLADLEGREFVYFPLQTEPEFSLNWQSPEYFFQLPTIAQIARDLPAGTLLAVKETYFAVGRRPDNFYDQIRDFKNVVLLDMLEPGLEVIRRAAVTVTITGSSGHEAAVLGKPVISFGRHNPFNILPHVEVVRDGAKLKRALDKFLAGAFDAGRAVVDGKRYLQAVADNSFDMEDFNYMEAGAAPPAAVEAAYEALLTSLEWTEPHLASAREASAGAAR